MFDVQVLSRIVVFCERFQYVYYIILLYFSEVLMHISPNMNREKERLFVMNQLHQKYYEKFVCLKEMYEKYGFSSILTELDSDIANISDFKVTVPLVGGFSTGKSSLLKELIGYGLLSTDITPANSDTCHNNHRYFDRCSCQSN